MHTFCFIHTCLWPKLVKYTHTLLALILTDGVFTETVCVKYLLEGQQLFPLNSGITSWPLYNTITVLQFSTFYAFKGAVFYLSVAFCTKNNCDLMLLNQFPPSIAPYLNRLFYGWMDGKLVQLVHNVPLKLKSYQ